MISSYLPGGRPPVPPDAGPDGKNRQVYRGRPEAAKTGKGHVMQDGDGTAHDEDGPLVGPGYDRVDATVFDPESKLAAASTREGTIHVFHEDSPDKFSSMETIKTEFGAKTMGLDPRTHRFYTDTSDFNAPTATAQQPNPQPAPIPGSLHLMIYTP